MAILTLDEIRNLDKTGFVVDAGGGLVPFLNPVRGFFRVNGGDDWNVESIGGFSVPSFLDFNDIPYNHQAKYSLYNVRGKWYVSQGANAFASEDSVPANTAPHQGPTPFHDRVNFGEISLQHDFYPQVPSSWCEDHDDYLFLAYHPFRRAFYKVTFADLICALGTDISVAGFNVDVQMPPLPGVGEPADLNGDGQVSVADILELLGAFGSESEPGTAFAAVHRDAVDPYNTGVSDAPNSTSLPIGTYSTTTSFEGNLIAQDWLGDGGFSVPNQIDIWDDIYADNADFAFFDTDVDILTATAFNAYAQISVVKVAPGDDYEIDHIKFDDPNFATNVQVDGQPAANNTTVTGKKPVINFSVDFEREYDKDSLLLFGVKVQHIKTDGTVENYYMSQSRLVPIGAGTSGTVQSFFETAGVYLQSPLNDANRFKTTINTQEWRVFVAVKPYGSPTAPAPVNTNITPGPNDPNIISSKFTSLKVSGIFVDELGNVNP